MTKQTTYQKWLRKMLRKHGEIKVDGHNTIAWAVPYGIIKITRIKYSESTIFASRPIVEVDIEYRGIIKLNNDWDMGPKGAINPGRYRSWNTIVSRNRRVRSCMENDIINYLKYFGVMFRWNTDFTIKKIVWKDTNI